MIKGQGTANVSLDLSVFYCVAAMENSSSTPKINFIEVSFEVDLKIE